MRSNFETEQLLGRHARLVLERIAPHFGSIFGRRMLLLSLLLIQRLLRGTVLLRQELGQFNVFLFHAQPDQRFQREQVLVVHFRQVITDEISQSDHIFHIVSRLSAALGNLMKTFKILIKFFYDFSISSHCHLATKCCTTFTNNWHWICRSEPCNLHR